MSYRESNDAGEFRNTKWYWPQFDSLEESYSVARKAYGGWIFAGMVCLGILISYFSGKSLTDLKTPETDLTSTLIGEAIELCFVLFASYRMTSGRGWIVSWFLLAVFAGEAILKVFGGRSIGWIFFYVAVGASMLGGARACWEIRSRLKAGGVAES